MQERKICLVNHQLIFPATQEDFIVKQSVIAGHFQWGESQCRGFLTCPVSSTVAWLVGGVSWSRYSRMYTVYFPFTFRLVAKHPPCLSEISVPAGRLERQGLAQPSNATLLDRDADLR